MPGQPYRAGGMPFQPSGWQRRNSCHSLFLRSISDRIEIFSLLSRESR